MYLEVPRLRVDIDRDLTEGGGARLDIDRDLTEAEDEGATVVDDAIPRVDHSPDLTLSPAWDGTSKAR